MAIFKELLDELKQVTSGKTLDALLPPFLFVIFNALFELNIAAIVAVSVAFIIVLFRVLTKKKSVYAFFGFFTVVFAASLAYIAQNATNYFLPGIIGSFVLFIVALISLIFRKPMAAYASHLTRGWQIEWFWRKDVIPAYMEVTVLWALFFLFRLVIQGVLYLQDDVVRLVWMNTLLGFPVTILVLITSYVYGIWRLRKLGGPGVDEFIEGKNPPWKGQTRGF
ncbi:DUF3159 domain-containing protein [Liberiplasma polymorphum]|uniref:DUF3159 domain-containing protein n=1 Tax=Liberiplasma polymorphum TaxID=3374570 RepID=UPI003770CEB9